VRLNNRKNINTRVVIQKKLPSLSQLKKLTGGKNFIVLYDAKLQRNKKLTSWLRPFENHLAVKAGEQLKTLKQIDLMTKAIIHFMAGFSRKENVIVSVGGGSVGDFSGFIASICKRGVQLVHVPSTWLAAIDSAHGGKNALNLGGFKNQLGTFYSAQAVICSKDLLYGQPFDNLQSAYGELLKISLLGVPEILGSLERKPLTEKLFWQLLPRAIAAKYKIVELDPYEQKGVREKLNLGHTLGHILELQFQVPHGVAVHYGLCFAVEFSYLLGYMSAHNFEKLKPVLCCHLPFFTKKPSAAKLSQFLLQDKKMNNSAQIKFVFLKKPGRAFIKKISLTKFVHNAVKMGWAIK
jgi:3-dehydroquinate synthase